MILNITEYLDQSVKLFPHKVAFASDELAVTYSELYRYSKGIGSTIFKELNGIYRKPIVVFVDRNVESIVSFLGVAYSGNFYVPIDIQMPTLRIELILKTLDPVATVVRGSDLEFAKRVAPGLKTFIYEETCFTEIDEESLDAARNSIIDTDPLYATFTSGSTGIPKGVITCHRSVIDMTEALYSTFGFSSTNVFGNQNPFYFDASIKDIYSTIKCGATMWIIPRSCFVLPSQLVPYLNDKKIDSILWSAAAIALAANTNAFDPLPPAFLRYVMFSGEVMHNKVLNYWRRALPSTMFVNLYGPTEITSVCSYYVVNRPFSDDEILPIGRPFRNTEILILNDDNQLVKEDEIGELCVRGCCLSMGYYNNPEKTKEAFVQNPVNSAYPDIIYRTGDLAKYNQEHQIIFLSRKDNQVKHMGQRVELGEIEILVNALDLIDASICFYDHSKLKIVLIYQGNDADKKYILNGLKDKLPKYMFPNIMIGLQDFPYNLNGKIDRTLLKKRYLDGEFNGL